MGKVAERASKAVVDALLLLEVGRDGIQVGSNVV